MKLKMMHRIFVLLLLAACNRRAATQETAKPETLSRYEATRIIADARKVVTVEGIDDSRVFAVNGTQQWITVCSKDGRNPIVLLLHGGPGSPEMPYDWAFQTPWEDFFTVMEWDQRGTRKTYALNDPVAIAPTKTVPQMLRDTEQVIEYLRRTYGKQNHSHRSFVGKPARRDDRAETPAMALRLRWRGPMGQHLEKRA